MIRTGLVGLGKMGISHQAIINAHPDLELVAVCDASRYLLEIMKRYTGVETYNDFGAMIRDANLDAVFVATPSRFHAEMVRVALERGLHVFCEKPFSLDARAGTELAELAAKKGLVNQVGYHNRFVAVFREAKRLISEGVLGSLHHVHAEAYGPVVLRPSGATWRSTRTEGGGCLYDYASHAIDLVNFMVGRPSAVAGVSMKSIFSSDVEDEVYATLLFDSGMSGQIAANWSDDSYRKMSTRITVWGANGRITADRQECQIHLSSAVQNGMGLPCGWTIRYGASLVKPVWYYLRGEEYSEQIDHFAKCILGQATLNESSFADALQTDEVIEALLGASGQFEVAVGRRQPRQVERPSLWWRWFHRGASRASGSRRP